MGLDLWAVPRAAVGPADVVEHALDDPQTAVAEPVQAVEAAGVGERDVGGGRLIDDAAHQPRVDSLAPP